MFRGAISVIAAFLFGAVCTVYGALIHRDHVFPYDLIHSIFGNPASAAADPNPWDSRSYRIRLGAIEAFPSKADVVMVGDSRVEIVDWRAAWPDLVVSNQGISGDTTAGLALRTNLIEQSGAKTIAIEIGVNDLKNGLAPAAVSERYASILKKLAPGRCLIVQAVVPTALGSELNSAISDLNSRLRELCRDNCRYVPLDTILAPSRELPASATVDGVHLTGLANLQWAQALRPHIDACMKMTN